MSSTRAAWYPRRAKTTMAASRSLRMVLRPWLRRARLLAGSPATAALDARARLGAVAGSTSATAGVGREGDLHRSALLLMGQRPHGVPPLLQAEPVRQHAGEVHAAGGGEVEVMGDGVLAHPVHLLHPEGVRAGDRELLEVE